MVKVIEAQVSKQNVRTSKGVEEPWQIWYADSTTGFHEYSNSFRTEKQAKDYARRYPENVVVIVHVNIPKMKY